MSWFNFQCEDVLLNILNPSICLLLIIIYPLPFSIEVEWREELTFLSNCCPNATIWPLLVHHPTVPTSAAGWMEELTLLIRFCKLIVLWLGPTKMLWVKYQQAGWLMWLSCHLVCTNVWVPRAAIPSWVGRCWLANL